MHSNLCRTTTHCVANGVTTISHAIDRGVSVSPVALQQQKNSVTQFQLTPALNFFAVRCEAAG